MHLCGFEIGLTRPFFLIAGPCVIESLQLQLDTAGTLKEITGRLGIPFIFKSSFDKANRSSGTSFRGPGMEEGLKVLAEVKRQIGVPVLTDVHEDTPIDEVASIVDVLQTPAFPGPPDQFHPERRARRQAGQHQEGPVPRAVGHETRRREVRAPSATIRSWSASAACRSATTTLVADMRALVQMRETGCPVVFDATHSVQLPGGQGGSGWPARVRPGAGARSGRGGISGLFMETHPDPSKALSDGPNAWPLDRMAALLETLSERRWLGSGVGC
jgi:2-dehydro-3-deoxyphosphooctonate aldolase (KDO 8-P synthase)